MNIAKVLMKQKIWVIAMAITVVVAYFAFTPAYAFEDGAPTATVTVQIDRADGEVSYFNDEAIEIGPKSKAEAAFTTYPMTTYTVDAPPIDPGYGYTIKFTITTRTTGPTSSPLTTQMTIWGNQSVVPADNVPQFGNLGVKFFYSKVTGSYDYDVEGSATGTIDTPMSITTPAFNGATPNQYPTYHAPILGSLIDGSEWDFYILSTTSTGAYGMTSFDLSIEVGAGGALTIGIDNISTEVVDP